MKSLTEIRLIVTLVIFVGITRCSVLKSNGTAGKELTAETLIELGREINKTMLTMIGKVMKNYHLCTEWSEWTKCGATKADIFSTRTKTRHCDIDKYGNISRVETKIGVCEGGSANATEKVCPTTYSTSTNGFCLKLYNTKQTLDDAISTCKKDGGFLVNIDSDQKYADVKAILTTNSVTNDIYIDGQWKNSNFQWEYTYGSSSGYFHWFSGYPVTNDGYNCLFLTGIRSAAAQRFETKIILVIAIVHSSVKF